MGSKPDDKNELTVLVTGFAPFRDEYPVNPSWEIAKGLPEYLPPSRAKDPSSRDSTSSASARAVRIMVHPEAVPVSYVGVRALVPTLWGDEDDDEDDASSRSSADVAVHIGMASARPTYGIERLAHRTGYKSPDVDGRLLEDEDADGGHGPGWVWRGLPDELHTDLDMPDVLARWRKLSPADADLHISDDPGRYLCDFIYYSSMAHLRAQQRPRKVVFLHVPATATEESIARGRDLAVNLIRAIVDSETAAAAAAAAQTA